MATLKNRNLISETHTIDATPLNPGNSGGGYGQYNVVFPYKQYDEHFIETTLDNESIVRGVANAAGLTTLTADNKTARLNHWYTVPPYIGSLNGYLEHIYVTVGVRLTTNISKYMIVPGFVGNVWDNLKLFVSAYGWEITPDLEIRVPPRNTVKPRFLTDTSWTIDTQNTSEKLDFVWRKISNYGTSIELLTPDQPLTVGAGETLVQDIEVKGSVLGIYQPQVLDYVPADVNYTGTVGAYCVAGNDGKPILADRWLNGGGDLRVSLTEDPSVLRVTITGSREEEYAPYQIATTAGTSSYYNSLHVTGSGMVWDEQTFSTYTGAPRATTAAETKTEIKNPFFVKLGDVINSAMYAIKEHCGGLKTVSFSASPIQFEVGDRVLIEGGYHRIVSKTDAGNNTSVSLVQDTQFRDWNNLHKGMTVGEFNELYEGHRFIDFNTGSLQK